MERLACAFSAIARVNLSRVQKSIKLYATVRETTIKTQRDFYLS